MNSKKIINIIGNILLILSFAFIIHKIIKYKINFYNLFSLQTFVVIIISIITYAIVVLTLAKMFETLLRIFVGSEILRGSIILIYCKSNLYKYLPGNIFHYIGRNQIAIDKEITHQTVITTTIIEILLLLLAGIITSIVFAGKYAFRWLFDNYTYNDVITVSIIILIILCLVIIIGKYSSGVNKSIVKNINQIKKIRLKVCFKFIIMYIITFVLNGVMFIMVLYSISGNIRNYLILPIIGMYSFSWIIGFITPGAPAGLGIREAVMSALLLGIVKENSVIMSVLLYRIVTILGDVLGYMIAYKSRTHIV